MTFPAEEPKIIAALSTFLTDLNVGNGLDSFENSNQSINIDALTINSWWQLRLLSAEFCKRINAASRFELQCRLFGNNACRPGNCIRLNGLARPGFPGVAVTSLRPGSLEQLATPHFKKSIDLITIDVDYWEQTEIDPGPLLSILLGLLHEKLEPKTKMPLQLKLSVGSGNRPIDKSIENPENRLSIEFPKFALKKITLLYRCDRPLREKMSVLLRYLVDGNDDIASIEGACPLLMSDFIETLPPGWKSMALKELEMKVSPPFKQIEGTLAAVANAATKTVLSLPNLKSLKLFNVDIPLDFQGLLSLTSLEEFSFSTRPYNCETIEPVIPKSNFKVYSGSIRNLSYDLPCKATVAKRLDLQQMFRISTVIENLSFGNFMPSFWSKALVSLTKERWFQHIRSLSISMLSHFDDKLLESQHMKEILCSFHTTKTLKELSLTHFTSNSSAFWCGSSGELISSLPPSLEMASFDHVIQLPRAKPGRDVSVLQMATAFKDWLTRLIIAVGNSTLIKLQSKSFYDGAVTDVAIQELCHYLQWHPKAVLAFEFGLRKLESMRIKHYYVDDVVNQLLNCEDNIVDEVDNDYDGCRIEMVFRSYSSGVDKTITIILQKFKQNSLDFSKLLEQ